MSYNALLGRSRGANMIAAYPERMTSADGTRWALGRNVKAETSVPGIYTGVQVWTLKERRDGKAVTVETGRSIETARRWIA
jgi:hypothetical protein